ncbi:chitooligosaccharidolytic beta-N-acetylglucosaminidase [Phlebotomus argentipes]|uniref:chitooligosaccharidolytic beta-N-acetylglucosaminidase n=1 Tax=Phlebotomus argentipes TaxID=94469 RepID=UPI002893159B|nr:chitooligosaccharidolytic beta-N-acetylglucosaminidase [Phlebotomus argentipes]
MLRLLLLLGTLTVAKADLWAFKCVQEQKCVRVNKNALNQETSFGEFNERIYETLKICRLVCGNHGALWPRPTGNTFIGPSLMQFHPNFIRFDFQDIPLATKDLMVDMTKLFMRSIKYECSSNCTLPSETEVIVRIFITSPDTTLSWDTVESYSLDISTLGTKVSVDIAAATVYGARHGLETLSQLITVQPGPENSYRNGLVITEAARIRDAPVYSHRGFMLDTARNFIPIRQIRKILDGMASTKLNVFHWHITDSQSFPLETPRVPLMAQWGAYSADAVYHQSDVRSVVRWSRARGIRVILELDAPAHAGNGWSWGPQHGLGELAICVNEQPWRNLCIQPPCGQLNPINPNLYHVLRDIYRDIMDVIAPEETIHMGGDEVFFPCWNSSQEIRDLLRSRGRDLQVEDFMQLWAEFQASALRIWDEESGRAPSSRDPRKPPPPVVLWSSHLTLPDTIEHYLEKERYVVQAWLKADDQIPSMLLEKGYRVIFSTKDAWYLDHGFWGITSYASWRKVYNNRIPTNDGVLGGETCLWSELVDLNTVETLTWPRTAALGERLWSNPDTGANLAETRFYRHRDRLVTREIRAEAVAPKWCVQNEGQCS